MVEPTLRRRRIHSLHLTRRDHQLRSRLAAHARLVSYHALQRRASRGRAATRRETEQATAAPPSARLQARLPNLHCPFAAAVATAQKASPSATTSRRSARETPRRSKWDVSGLPLQAKSIVTAATMKSGARSGVGGSQEREREGGVAVSNGSALRALGAASFGSEAHLTFTSRGRRSSRNHAFCRNVKRLVISER